MKISIIQPQIPKLKNIHQRISKVLKSGQLSNNSNNLINFENKLQKEFKSKFPPVVFSSGEMAFYSLIQAWMFYLKIKKCKAIVPSFTFSGTVNALILNNIEPIFCDINESLTININQNIKITKDVKFIIGVSTYGNIPNILEIKKFCKKNKIVFLLDSAPAFGSKFKNKYPNSLDIDEIYSFHATKVFNSIEGGCAISSKKIINKYLKSLRNFGQYTSKRIGFGDVEIPGLNSKMHEITASIGLENLATIKKALKSRQNVIHKYLAFFNFLENRKKIKTMKVHQDTKCNYSVFPIILNNNRNKFIDFMNKKNILCRKYYTAVHQLKFYRKKFFCTNYFLNCSCKKYCSKMEGLQNTKNIAGKVVALPLHNYSSKKKIAYIFTNIINYFGIKKTADFKNYY